MGNPDSQANGGLVMTFAVAFFGYFVVGFATEAAWISFNDERGTDGVAITLWPFFWLVAVTVGIARIWRWVARCGACGVNRRADGTWP